MESEETDTINIDINDVDEQFFIGQIKEFQERYIKNGKKYVFNPDNVSDEEKETLKTILFCCNTKFFLNKDNIDYNNAKNLSHAVSVLQDKLVTDAVSLKLIAQSNNAKQINNINGYVYDIDTKKKIPSGLSFEDELSNTYEVNFCNDNYWKHLDNAKGKKIAHGRRLLQGNQLHMIHGEFISDVYAKGTYIIISKNQIKNSTANEIIIDICYNYKNNNAPRITVGGGSVFRITLTQKEGEYALNSIKKGNMIEDKVDEDSLSETDKNAIQTVVNDEVTGQSLRETLAEEPELCKVLQEAQVITEKQCEQIMPKNTIEEDNNTFKEEIATTPEYNLWCLQNPFIGKNKSTGKWGCCGINCC